MSRRMVSRLVFVVLIALPLAGPARAEAADLTAPRSAWSWFASLWEEGISALWPWSEASTEKGGSIDPNGGLNRSGSGTTTTATTPPTTGQGEEGHGIDPNGTP